MPNHLSSEDLSSTHLELSEFFKTWFRVYMLDKHLCSYLMEKDVVDPPSQWQVKRRIVFAHVYRRNEPTAVFLGTLMFKLCGDGK